MHQSILITKRNNIPSRHHYIFVRSGLYLLIIEPPLPLFVGDQWWEKCTQPVFLCYVVILVIDRVESRVVRVVSALTPTQQDVVHALREIVLAVPVAKEPPTVLQISLKLLENVIFTFDGC